MAENLRPEGIPVTIGTVRISTPGLTGRVSRGICYAPAYTLMGGTTQILRNIIGERILGLPR